MRIRKQINHENWPCLLGTLSSLLPISLHPLLLWIQATSLLFLFLISITFHISIVPLWLIMLTLQCSILIITMFFLMGWGLCMPIHTFWPLWVFTARILTNRVCFRMVCSGCCLIRVRLFLVWGQLQTPVKGKENLLSNKKMPILSILFLING